MRVFSASSSRAAAIFTSDLDNTSLEPFAVDAPACAGAPPLSSRQNFMQTFESPVDVDAVRDGPYSWGGVIMQMKVAVFFVGFATSASRLLSKWIASPSSSVKHWSSVSVISMAPVST